MHDHELREILLSYKTIASVGLSSNPAKVSYGVVDYLKSQGYRVIPVNPTADEIQGEKSYPDLLTVPEPIEIVQVFRLSEDVPPIVDQAIQIGAKVVWMQLGISNPEAARKAEADGLKVVMDHCMRVEHLRLIGAHAIGHHGG